jgi:hypothetical protein
MTESTLVGVLPRDGGGSYVRRTGSWIGQEQIRCLTESGSPHSHIGRCKEGGVGKPGMSNS